MEFTTEKLDALDLPAGKTDYIVFDEALPGFGIRLREGGKRVWIIQYRANGRQRRETLGDVRRIALKPARAAAQKRFAAVLLGRDPQQEKAEARARAGQRLGPLAERYLASKVTDVRKNTMIADRRYLLNYAKPLHGRPVHEVDRRAIASRLSEVVTERGTTAAARFRQSLSGFFAWLVREGIVDHNPVIGTNNPGLHLAARDRVLTAAELRAIWWACRDDDFGRILKVLMLTGARRDEIGGLRWSELDLDQALLTIPGTRTKNHHPLQLTLPAAAVAILRETPRRADRDFVFGGRGGAFSAWSYCTLTLAARIVEMQGVSVAPWRIHDVRRSVATGMAEIGVQPHIIEAVLNHRSGHKAGVAGVYNRASYTGEIKQALARWAEHLDVLLTGRREVVARMRFA